MRSSLIRPVLLTILTIESLNAFATGARLIDYRVIGPAVESVYDTSSGVSATLGVPVSDCRIRGDQRGGVTSLVFTVEPNDGGLISFSYSFETINGWTAGLNEPWMWSNTFKAQLRMGPDNYPGSDQRETLFADRWTNCVPRSTGWVHTTIRIPPASQLPVSPYPLELWMSVAVAPTGYISEWQDGGVYPSYVQIRDVIAVCSNGTPSMTLPATTIRADRPGRVASNATPVTSTCKGCCIGDLTPVDPSDVDSITMESGYNAWYWLPKTTPEIQTATTCFKTAMEDANDTFVLSNTLRTLWYQRHFYEVWTKYQALRKDTNPACGQIKTKVTTEKNKHLLVRKPATGNGEKAARHVNGEAIDISTNASNQTQEARDALADGCSLYRRVADDYVHYEVKP